MLNAECTTSHHYAEHRMTQAETTMPSVSSEADALGSNDSLSEPLIQSTSPTTSPPLNEHEGACQEEDHSTVVHDNTTDAAEANTQNENSNQEQKTAEDNLKLALIFISMVLVGTGVSVFGKLVALPLYNYPNFLNLYSVVLYVVVTFIYVMFMMIRYGDEVITLEQRQIPKRTFAIFGLLDTLSIGVQTFASCYISGPLRILLPQAAIPFSMLFSWYFQNKRFRPIQYAGASVVILGIFLVLEPMLMPSAPTSTSNSTGFVCETNLQEFDVDEFCYVCRDEITQAGCLSHNETRPSDGIGNNNATSDIIHLCTWIPTEDSDTSTDQGTGMIWSLAVILSCIPMTLSSLYKEITVSKVEVEPLYMNGWTAFFQLPYSLGLAVMAAPLFSPPIEPHELPRHLLNAWDCYYHGRGTVDHGCHLDDECGKAFWLWNLNFALIVMYTILSVLLLKYGSTSLLYLALTITVPLGNLAFCLPFMPGYAPMRITDLLGLIVIVLGLVLYRSSGDTEEAENSEREQAAPVDDVLESLQEPLLQEHQEQQ